MPRPWDPADATTRTVATAGRTVLFSATLLMIALAGLMLFPQGVLKSLARTTGGERFLPRSPGELLTTCERIAREIRGGYTIGYVPPARDGAYHRVKVEMAPSTARGLNVRTRPGYFAAAPPTHP